MTYNLLLTILTPLLYLQALPILQIHALTCNITYPSTSHTTYPTRAQICSTFSHLTGRNANYTGFFSQVADNVNWIIEGTHALAGQYNNKTVLEAAFIRIDDTGSADAPLTISIINVIGGGNEEWSVVELQVLGVCRNGMSSYLSWKTSTHSWIDEIMSFQAYSLTIGMLGRPDGVKTVLLWKPGRILTLCW